MSNVFSLLTKNIGNVTSATFNNPLDPLCAGRRRVFFSNTLSSIFINLTTGSYFTALMLAIGAGEQYISWITMIVTLSGIVQFLSPLVLERMAKRKPFLLGMRILYYFTDILVLGGIPLLTIPQELRLVIFMAAVIISNAANSISISGISIWQIQSIPGEVQNNFFTFSNFSQTLAGVITGYCAGAVLDDFEANSLTLFGIAPSVSAILVLRIIALITVIPDVYFLVRLKEYPYAGEIGKEKLDLRLLVEPLGNRRFMLTVSANIFWTVMVAVIGNFYNYYLIEIVGMSYTYMSLGGIISMPLILVLTPVWSVIITKINWHRALPLAYALYSFAYLFNALTTADTKYFYLIVIVCCYLGIPCMNVVNAYLPYMNMPDTHRTAYISLLALANTLASFLGNFLGDRFMYFTNGYVLNFFGLEMLNYQYLNLVQMAFALMIAVYVAVVGRYLINRK